MRIMLEILNYQHTPNYDFLLIYSFCEALEFVVRAVLRVVERAVVRLTLRVFLGFGRTYRAALGEMDRLGLGGDTGP